jgi:hypothetical protein
MWSAFTPNNKQENPLPVQQKSSHKLDTTELETPTGIVFNSQLVPTEFAVHLSLTCGLRAPFERLRGARESGRTTRIEGMGRVETAKRTLLSRVYAPTQGIAKCAIEVL